MKLSDLKEVIFYDPLTGIFKWNKNRQRCKKGVVVGALHNQGYLQIGVLGKRYLSHRLAWFYMTGVWPKDQIDHINQIKNDNRFSNLRECNQSQNNANNAIRKDSTSGYKGVTWCKAESKWYAQIHHLRKHIHLGIYNCRHEAAKAYNRKALVLFGDYAYLNEIKDLHTWLKV